MATVLVVDDNQFMRKKLKDILEHNGYYVIGEAENGREAIDIFEEHEPDLVTMDITMPLMDGIEATRAILRLDPSAKIVVISAVGTKQMVYKAIKLGAKNFIVKPLTQDKVLSVIKKVQPPLHEFL